MARQRKGYAAQVAALERGDSLEKGLKKTSIVIPENKKLKRPKGKGLILEFLLGKRAYADRFKGAAEKARKRRLKRRRRY